MCSKNQEVDPLFAQFITKDFLIQRIFRVLRNSLFRTNDLYSKNKTEQDLCKERTCSVFLQGYYLKKGQGKNLLRFFAGILFEEGIVFRKYQSLF